MKRTNTLTNVQESRQDRLILERVHDPYRIRGKLPEPTVCPKCGAVFLDRRWQWSDTHLWGAKEAVCPTTP
jgi:hypothetical protein